MAVSLPKKIGKYDVLDVIGKGGMGIVYRAKDPFLDRMVAIKIMTISSADSSEFLPRFLREAKATAQLQHPNIVTVFELGEHEGSPYIAMQYLEGASLAAILRSKQELPLLQKIDIIVQTCHGLAYAHQKGIIHRDIKPDNIMVLKDGSVKIVDFGIARIGDTNFTRTGQFMGSLNYMSLEQLNDKVQVDQRTDVYSTGVVLYQMLTGVLPFDADNAGSILMKILNDAAPPFSKFISSYPPEIEEITMKALAKDRDQRYGSADDLAFDLAQLQERLKQERIGIHLQRVERLLQQNEIFQANDELQEILKLDKQHTRASSMARDLKKRIEKEESVERVRQLRQQAEEALRREEYDPALGFIERAIQLDPTNADLSGMRTKVQAAKAQIEHLRQVMVRAENAHRAGNLDTAKQAIEEVLAVRPNDTRVMSLYRMIQKELDERLRQKRLENLLESARKEMSSRRYTAAFEILKEAEKVDPESPSLRSLLDTFNAARDQERRRKALEQVTRQVEQALNTDDHKAALSSLTEGLKHFPGEPALLKLKDLAESQQRAAQAKTFVREQIATAREILNAGNPAGAIKVLQDALKKVPGNALLESQISSAQERITQDRDDQAKERCVQQANEALDKRAYDEAIRLLEAGQIRFTTSPEIDNLLRFAREQQAKEAKQQDVDKSVRKAQDFLRNQEYDQAISLLESVISRVPDEELSIVLEESRRRRDALNGQIAAAIARGQQFLQEGSAGKAAEFLQAQPASFRRSGQFRELLAATAEQSRQQESSREQEQITTAEYGEAPEPVETRIYPAMPTPARAPSRRIVLPAPSTDEPNVGPPGFLQRFTNPQKMVAAAVVLVLCVVVVIAIWLTSNPVEKTVDKDKDHPPQPFVTPNPPQPPAKGTVLVQTNETMVDIIAGGKIVATSSGNRLSVSLPTGKYVIGVKKYGFDSKPDSQQIEIQADVVKSLQFTLTPSKTPQPPPQEAYLLITGTAGAEVSVDDNVQALRLSGNPLLVKVAPGVSHTVVARLQGYVQFTRSDLRVEAGKRQQVQAVLDPLPKPEVVSFKGPDGEVSSGKVTLSWETKNATSVEITPGVGTVQKPDGYAEAIVAEKTMFSLVAKGDGGTSPPTTYTVRIKQPVVANPPATPIATSTPISVAADPKPVTVEPKPVTPTTKDESQEIKAALARFSTAYGQQVVKELKKEWTGMTKEDAKKLDKLFSQTDIKAVSVKFENCGAPTIVDNTANVNCVEKGSYTSGRDIRPENPFQVAISLKRASDGWRVDTKVPVKK